MALVDTLFDRQQVTFFASEGIGSIVILDASVSETYSTQADVTEHPVEQGVKVTDHVRARPREIRIEGVVSNTPNLIAATINSDGQPSGIRAETAYFDMLDHQREGRVITILTSLFEFSNMLIISIDLTRDVDTANIAKMSIVAREVFTVGDSTLAPDPTIDLLARKASLGKRALGLSLYTAGLAAASAGVTAAVRAINKANA